MNSKNSETSDPYRLLLNLTSKINLKRNDKYVALSNWAFSIHGKIWKSHTKLINSNYQLRHGMKDLNYLMVHIL